MGSGPASPLRSSRFAVTARRPSRATRSSITCSRPNPEVKRALVERLGEEILGEDGAPDRERIAFKVFRDREALDFLEKLLHPLVSREYMTWREQLAKLPNPPEVCVTEVPLLYEVGAEKRFDKVVVITAPSKLREARRVAAADDREARLIPDRRRRSAPTSRT